MRRRSGATVVALAAVWVVVTAPRSALADDLGAFSGPVRFAAPDGVEVTVGDRRYVGTLEARVGRGGGVTLVDELSLDAYLEGLAEVPVSWPTEALRAQVVAARTYAWWEASSGAWADAGFDLCGTQACQVFAGRDVADRDDEGRWAAAVAGTTGEVLVDDLGAPLLARYSSSNGGASVANVEAFPEDGDPPYLQRVEDPFDAVSPWHEWQVAFARSDLDAILARGERLAAAVPLADIVLEEVADGVDRVVVTGRDGTEVAVDADEFRFFVSRVAPDVAPERYPARRPDVEGRYPATLLSSQLSFHVTSDTVVVDGRGFGHGVGMSQYGALGRAEAGQSHADVLAAYYGGIRPTTPPTVPERIRVGLVEDADEVTLSLPRPMPVVVGDTVLTERGLGTWTVRRRPDRTVQLVAPAGFGAPLVVDPTTAAADRAAPAGVVRLGTVVNKPVELLVEVRDEQGTLLTSTSAGFVEAGRHAVDWSVGASLAAAVRAGAPATTDGVQVWTDLAVALVAVDEDAERAGTATTITVGSDGTVAGVLGDAAVPAPPRADPVPVALAGGLGVVFGGSLHVVAGRRRRADGPPGRPPTPQEEP